MKTEGEQKECEKCGETLTCGINQYNNELQWQNENGRAHYGYDEENEEFYCKENSDVKKVLHAEKECRKCGTRIYCRLKEYKNSKNVLQWQNRDGQAHYKFISNGVFECRHIKEGRLNCYVCGSTNYLTNFQYPKETKSVCLNCEKALVEGLKIYKEKHPEFDHPCLHNGDRKK